MEHFDVIVVGAGLSGIGAGFHLQRDCPDRSYMILEGRETIGGTWDLFRYPGIRSDSDMYTLGYSFKPWREAKAIADGPSILRYVRETAAEHGIDKKIRFHHRVVGADWSTKDGKWLVRAEQGPEKTPVTFSCGFLFMCSGYYDYAGGYTPEFAGAEAFGGRVVHPQKWPEGLDYTGKRVVVIGSGATAVTLVPEMAKTAAHVVMLQRSPTYIVSRPAEDQLANRLRARLPAMLAYQLVRWKNVLMAMFFFNLARKRPAKVKQGIIDMVAAELGPDYDVKTHFTPRYNPWDQRVCLVPDGDLFDAIKSGAAEIVTDEIDSFVPAGIRLKSGKEVAADIIVTATGLKMQFMSGLVATVDGAKANFAEKMTYKGMMYSDVPNLAQAFGYTNASWTLKCDLTCEYVCRLLNHMRKNHQTQCVPRLPQQGVTVQPFLDFSSGYVLRARDELPKQGAVAPWRVYQNYLLDLLALRFGRVEDGTLRFS